MAYTLWSTGKFNSASQRTLRSDSMIKKHAGYGRQSGITAGLRVSHLEFWFFGRVKHGTKCGCSRWNRVAICYRSRVVSISGLTTVILHSAMMTWSKASRVEEQMGSRCSFVNISFRSELQLRLYSSALQSVTVCFIATMLNVTMLLLLPTRTLLGYKKQTG